jgi:disulfide bond formation protein DsbB
MNLSSYTPDVVRLLSTLTVAGQIIVLVLLVGLFFKDSRLSAWVTRNALVLMLIVALTATLGSLFFSDIAGWNPCKDCWLQRIVMYPQVVLLAVALWKKDAGVRSYILPLCILGIVIAAWHYTSQVQAAMQPPEVSLVPCDTSGESCAKTQIHFTYGYITIPMMALTAFVLNAIGSVYLLRSKK